MPPRTVLEALTRGPLRYLGTAWPWRAAGFLLCGGLFAAAVYVAVGALVTSPFGVVTGTLCGLLVVAFAGGVAGPLERWRLRLVDRDGEGGNGEEPAPWRASRWTHGYGIVSVLALGWADLAVVLVSLGIPGFLLLSPLQPTAAAWQTVAGPVAGALLLPVAAYPIGAWAGVRGAVARAVCVPGERELREVVRSRARLVDAFETERRRIERDLHDGAQQRLVALHVKLGLASMDLAALGLPPGSAAVREVGEAHALAKEALAELRELIRGVHPQVLSERGLHAALRDVAGRSTVPAELALDLPGRLPAGVETTAYFVVSECLANVARHSGATRCRIGARVHAGVLRLEVEDDGGGGAEPGGGSGLTGLADRVAAADGRILLSSPPGGPTLLRAEIPCGSPSGS